MDFRFKFFGCGEYGEVCYYCTLHKSKCSCPAYKPMLGRPHFHLILFGYDVPVETMKLWSIKRGNPLYVSDTIADAWDHKGFHTIGNVTFQSCAYVARYVTKKYSGENAKKHYERVDRETGEIFNLVPEFVRMSRGGPPDKSGKQQFGIGKEWVDKFKGDLDKDFITIAGRKFSLPRYYDSFFDEDTLTIKKAKRRREARKRKEDNTPDRLRVKEKIKRIQINQLIREVV